MAETTAIMAINANTVGTLIRQMAGVIADANNINQ